VTLRGVVGDAEAEVLRLDDARAGDEEQAVAGEADGAHQGGSGRHKNLLNDAPANPPKAEPPRAGAGG